MSKKYREKNPFTVPDGYFDGLTDRVMEHVETRVEARKPALLEILRPYIGIAAMFAVMMGVMHLVVPSATETGATPVENVVAEGASEGIYTDEDVFDSAFNPTGDEIIEYLVTEIDDYDMILADVY